MKKRLLWWIIIPMYIIVLGCEDSSEGDEENESIAITGDLRSAPQLFSLTDGIFGMSTYDLKFFFTMELNPPYGAYAVGLNSAVGVQAAVDLAHDFDSASLPDTGYSYDGDSTYVIGGT